MLGFQRAIARRALSATKSSSNPARTVVQLRQFSRSAAMLEAQSFDMPSMSPTMEEGGIVEWKVKQGDSFKAGDVSLDIETDKAEIAVEAGDDGILAKILVQNGEKGIPVGKAIAVTAEPGDDVASIDVDSLLSARESAKASSSAKSVPSQPSETPSKPSAPASSAPSSPSSSSSSSSSPSSAADEAAKHSGHHGSEPLPSALRSSHENHLDAKDIQGTGPFGRVTKGDVLAYLGKIPQTYVQEESARFAKSQKMDLSNVQPATPKPEASSDANAAAKKKESKPKPLPIVTSVSIPINSSVAAKVGPAQRKAMREALLSLKPRASVLRDPIFDALTASGKPPFIIKSAEVAISRGRPISYDVVIEEPPAARSNPAVDVFMAKLRSELSIQPVQAAV